MAKRFASENDMEYFEVSAKTGELVDESFLRLTTNINGMKLTAQQMMLGGDNQVKLDQDGNEVDADGNGAGVGTGMNDSCLLYTSPSPRDGLLSRMPSSA